MVEIILSSIFGKGNSFLFSNLPEGATSQGHRWVWVQLNQCFLRKGAIAPLIFKENPIHTICTHRSKGEKIEENNFAPFARYS